MKSKKGRAPKPPTAEIDPVEARSAAGIEASSKAVLSVRRKWTLRLVAAVGMPALALAILELALRILGYGYPTSFFLPSPIPTSSAVVENRQFSRRYFSEALMRVPKSIAFTPAKPPQTLRLFIFGESAAEGDPAPPFGFARILAVLLQARYPDRKIEVINTAVTAINSHVIRPIAQECANYSSDVWVVYLGNNEVVGPFGSGSIFGAQTPSLPLVRANIALKATRTGQFLEAAMSAIGPRKYPQSWGGMEMFLEQQVREADPRMATVYSHFERNLADIVKCGTGSGAKVVLSTVGSNLRDCPPLASLHRADLSSAQKAEWMGHYEAGVALETSQKPAEAILKYQAAASVDDQFAELHFRWARCLINLQRAEEARTHYLRARDLDALRFRADSRINVIIRRLAEAWGARGVSLADAEAALARSSEGEVPGQDFFYEHVHFTFPGNYLVARELAEQIVHLLAKGDSIAKGERNSTWPSLEACAQRLGLTDWERCQMSGEMMRRTSRPPFTNQLDHAADAARRTAMVAQLEELSRDNFPAAVTIYQQAIAAAPEDWQLHDNFAGALLQHGDRGQAIEQWRIVRRLLPHRVQTYDLLGSLLFEQGKLEEAEECYQQAVKIQPAYVDGLIGLGRIWLAQKRGPEALGQFRLAAKLLPTAGRPHNHLGVALLQLGQAGEAERAFLTALDVEPDFLPARLNLGKALAKDGKLEAALEQFGEAARRHPEDFDAQETLANTLIRQNRWAEAAPHLAAAVRLRPNSYEAHLNYGTVLAKQQMPAEACAQFAEALRIKPDFVPAHLNLAIALRNQNQLEQARNHVEAALRIDPGNAVARRLLDGMGGR